MGANVTIEKLSRDRFDEAVDVATLAFGEDLRDEAAMDFGIGFSDFPRPFSTFVALKDDRIVGTVQCFMAYFSHNTYAIDWLAVSPQHQNQGVGARLVTKSCEHIEKEFLKGQRGTILLASDNGPSFYSKFGFEPAFNLHSGDPVMMKTVEGTQQ